MHTRKQFFSILHTVLPLFLLIQTTATLAASPLPSEILADNAQTVSTITLTPQSIPVSNSELVNPMRGFHEWRGINTVPQPETAQDTYQRYFWRDPENPSQSLETSRGIYNFSAIDADIAAAEARGQKFAFRIRAMGNDSSGKRYIPDYLSSCGWGYNGTFIPDWNRSCFLDNAANLINALGERYNNDPRIAWMDLGIYGRWGEWAMSESIYNSAPSGVSVASDATLERIVEMQLNAFPNVRKVMMVKTRSAPVVRALSSSDQVGWRVDCLGKAGYFDFPTNSNYAAAWAYMQNRWQTAPVIVEFCANDVDPTYNTAINQVRDFHIASIGNGNIDSWSGKTSTQQQNLVTLGKTAGYRFRIRDLVIPDNWIQNSAFTITARWENVGVTPHYETARVSYKLYHSSSSAYVWEGLSSVNLKTLLPTGGTPVSVSDSFTLPANLTPGSYQLRVMITDPSGYRKPLKLAINGLQNDGSYSLGTITVRTSATPTSVPTSTPTATPTSIPTTAPTATPTATATRLPTSTPTTAPTATPTRAPTQIATPTLRTTTFNPTADTYVVSSSSTKNYGSQTTTRVNNSPTEITYLRFNLSSLNGRTITQAKLRVRVSNAATDSTRQNVKIVQNNSWGESSLNYNNRPSLSSTVYGYFQGGSYGAWVEVDLTSLIQSRAGTSFSLAVVTSSTDSFAFYTRESTNKPQMNVTYR